MQGCILLNFYNSEIPFVIQEGKQYFIYTNHIDSVKNGYRTEYTDDVDILLNAIKNVKPIDYQELDKLPASTKEEYWQKCFNYMYNNGGLIRWTNPTQSWNEELCRRGQLECSKCHSKMIMYYKPQCYVCNKPQKEGKHLYLIPVCYYVSLKHDLGPEVVWRRIHDYNCESGAFKGNDSFIDYDLQDEEYYQDKELYQYLKWIDEEYPFQDNVFYISW